MSETAGFSPESSVGATRLFDGEPFSPSIYNPYMTHDSPASIAELAAAVPDGAKLAIPNENCGIAMAATRELVRRGARNLHLVTVPVAGLQADILIGAGCVSVIETSGVTLGEYGTGPRFAAAVREGRVRVLDATCPAIYAALQAGEKGIPFMPLRGLLGTDVLKNRREWTVIDNPFRAIGVGEDPIVLLPAIRPDTALFHAPLADRQGNVFVGRKRELLTMAHAARQTLVTVEEIGEAGLFDDPALAAGVVPAIYVTRIALARRGAWPLALTDRYGADEQMLARYAELARTEQGFADFLHEWLASDPVALAA